MYIYTYSIEIQQYICTTLNIHRQILYTSYVLSSNKYIYIYINIYIYIAYIYISQVPGGTVLNLQVSYVAGHKLAFLILDFLPVGYIFREDCTCQ